MRLEVRHAYLLFFATVGLDLLIFQLASGFELFTVGAVTTAREQAGPAAAYLGLCFVAGWLAINSFPRPPEANSFNWPNTERQAWLLVGLSILVILAVAGSDFFEINPNKRQLVFIENPWIARSLLFSLPLAMGAIVIARNRTKLVIASLLITFYSLSGSRIHILALMVALIVSISNRKVKIWHLLAGGFVFLILLDVLARIRTQGSIDGSYSINLVEMFETGHYSTFDVQTILLEYHYRLKLDVGYLVSAAIGPLREFFALANQASSSEFFTLMNDPLRYYASRSLVTVGLSGELFMVFGWFGWVIFAAIFAILGQLNRILLHISRNNEQIEVILRAIFIVYAYVLLRADMWIFFVYLWLQLPALFLLALHFRLRGLQQGALAPNSSG